MKNLLKNLTVLADQLDDINAIKMANEIDVLLKKIKGRTLSNNIVSEAVYEARFEEGRWSGDKAFFIDRAIGHLEEAENYIQNIAGLEIDGVRVEIIDAKRKLEQLLLESSTVTPISAEASNSEKLKKIAVIRKLKNQWCVLSRTGEKLGCYASKKAAEKRLKQIEFWKHNKG